MLPELIGSFELTVSFFEQQVSDLMSGDAQGVAAGQARVARTEESRDARSPQGLQTAAAWIERERPGRRPGR